MAYTRKELSELTGLSLYQITECGKILENDNVFKSDKVYADYSACLGKRYTLNVIHEGNELWAILRSFLISDLTNIGIYIFDRIDIKKQRSLFKSKNDLKQKFGKVDENIRRRVRGFKKIYKDWEKIIEFYRNCKKLGRCCGRSPTWLHLHTHFRISKFLLAYFFTVPDKKAFFYIISYFFINVKCPLPILNPLPYITKKMTVRQRVAYDPRSGPRVPIGAAALGACCHFTTLKRHASTH